MKVHVFTTAQFPEGMAATKRILCYAHGWKSVGIESEIVICRYIGSESTRFHKNGETQEVKYQYLVNNEKSKNYFVKQYRWFVGDFLRVIPYICKSVNKGDISYVYLYNNICQLLIILFSKIKGAKVIREVCEHPSALGRGSSVERLFRFIEYRFILPLYDGFVPISRELDKFVSKYKSKKAKSVIVPILVKQAKASDITETDRLYDVPYIIHTGTMLEQKDSISIILKAFAEFKKKDKFQTRMVFTGPHANNSCTYLTLIDDLGIQKWVDLRGLVSAREISVLQHFATLSIIYKSDNLQTRNCFPTKLGEVLMNGTPVITTSVGDANMYLKDNESAIIVEPGDIQILSNRIDMLIRNQQLREMLSKNGKHVAERSFSPSCQGQRMAHFFNEICGRDD